jgi:hypothetical protein
LKAGVGTHEFFIPVMPLAGMTQLTTTSETRADALAVAGFEARFQPVRTL